MLALLFALQAAVPPAAEDSLPQVTLREALQRAVQLDPNYVSALGQVDNAAWARRNAFAVFVLPSVTVGTQMQWQNPPGFSVVPLRKVVVASLSASYVCHGLSWVGESAPPERLMPHRSTRPRRPSCLSHWRTRSARRRRKAPAIVRPPPTSVPQAPVTVANSVPICPRRLSRSTRLRSTRCSIPSSSNRRRSYSTCRSHCGTTVSE